MNGLLLFAVVPSDRVDPDCFRAGEDLPPGLRPIVEGPIAALVGSSPAGGLEGLDRAALAPWLLANQKLLERALDLGPVLPVTFGTAVEDEARVRQLLTSGAPLFLRMFDALGDRCEMDLSVRWRLEHEIPRLVHRVPSAVRVAAEAGGEEARQALGEALRHVAQAEQARLRHALVTTLRAQVCDIILTEPADPECVADMALLVERDGVDVLGNCLEVLDAAHADRLTFRLVGPLAPYSFAAVQVHLSPAEAIPEACAALGVEPGTSEAELKAAYRHAMRRVHPDLAPEASAGITRPGIVALTSAYRTLRAEHCPVSLRRRDSAPAA